MLEKCTAAKRCGKGVSAARSRAPLVLAGEHLFATNQSGKTFIFKASREALAKLVGENRLGSEVHQQPPLCTAAAHFHMRVTASEKGRRRGWLFFLGKARGWPRVSLASTSHTPTATTTTNPCNDLATQARKLLL